MISNEKTIRVLNDLIQTNHDRIAGYEKAISEAGEMDMDIKAIFGKMIQESRQNNIELSNEVAALGGEPATSSTIGGKIYRIWMDVKTSLSSSDRLAILDSCEYGEDVAVEAYEDALQSDADMTVALLNLITRQKAGIQLAHNQVRSYRDANAVIR
ncbi:PA2169 family four-helix-bundle protein [Pollutibacter soli]|uniref:ferritin-like domain-containing protein n=1 Tax=Pollutibacter soli TaxID=3034157 RepID=UPI003014182E